MLDKKNILIVTYYWPPAGGAGVQRWLKFVKYLSKYNYKIFVYTVANPEAPENDNSLLQDIPDSITVTKHPIWEPFNIYKKITGKKGNFNAGFLNEEKEKKKSFAEKLSLFVRGNFFIPDAKMFWIKPSVKFLSKFINNKKIGNLITTGPPHSVNVIGLKLKNKHKNINWVADFRDPWTNIDFYRELNLTSFADKIHHKLELKVLQTADKVITVGNTMKREFEEISNRKDIVVITNGYDADDFVNYKKQKNNKFTIAHIGSINKDRNHEAFYKAVSSFISKKQLTKEQINLVFVGKLDIEAKQSLEKYNLSGFTKIINYLPHNEAIQYMFNADLLYLPINNTPNAKGILTGKFFEYLATKNPILAIGPTDGDIAQIIRQTNSGEIFNFDDVTGIKKFLLDFNTKKYLFNNIEEYSREQLTKKLISIINLSST